MNLVLREDVRLLQGGQFGPFSTAIYCRAPAVRPFLEHGPRAIIPLGNLSVVHQE